MKSISVARYKKRPETPDEMERRAEEFFAYCEENGQPPTILGLAYFTGWSNRQEMNRYRWTAEWKDVVNSAITRIAMGYEMRLFSSSSSAGAIFALKVIDGWEERFVIQNEDNTESGQLEVSPAIRAHIERIKAAQDANRLSMEAINQVALPAADLTVEVETEMEQ